MRLTHRAAGLLAALTLPFACMAPAYAADTTLTPSTLLQVEVGASEDSWGDKLNGNAAIINDWFTTGPALKLANGGTGATTASGARTALGLGSIATQAASSVAITGGAFNGTVGASTPSTIGATTVTASGVVTTIGVDVSQPGSTFRLITFRSSGAIRASVGVDNLPDSGGGAGSDFHIYRYDDASTPIGVLQVSRASGAATAEGVWSFSTYLKTQVTNVAGLTACATAGAGSRSFVTNATATTFATIVAGGGVNGVPVYCDGTNWRIG